MNSSEEYVNFDPFSEKYDETRAVSDDILKLFLQTFLEVNNKSNYPFKNILEIGCGTGRVSRIFALNDFNMTGVDVSKNMLDIALMKAKRENWNFNGFLVDARKLPFKDNEFDIAYTVNVLHLIKDWKQVIKEALRCSKSNRFCNVILERTIFSTAIMKNYWKFLTDSGYMTNFQTNKKIGAQNPNTVIDFMEQEGFNYIKEEKSIGTTLKRDFLIEVTISKVFSGQRMVPDDIHKLALQYLKEHDYFLPKSIEDVSITEKFVMYSFFKD